MLLKPGCFSNGKTRTWSKHLQHPLLPIMTSWFAGHNWNIVRFLLFVHRFTTSHPKDQSQKHQNKYFYIILYLLVSPTFQRQHSSASVGSWDISQNDFICQMYGLRSETTCTYLRPRTAGASVWRGAPRINLQLYGSVGTRYYTYSIILASGL